MNPWSRVVAVVGVARAKIAAVVVVALFATAGLGSLGAQLLGASSGSGITDYPTLARRAGDADLDGLPDVLENRLGSSPDRRDTLGQGVPDGWVYTWFRGATDWNDTAALDQPALVPPPESLPAALQGPGQLRLPTVAELYALEAAGRGEGTWWLDVPAVDPLQWDNDGDGIADAWLVAHGLRPWETKADQPAPGDASYTLREKYEQGLDPSTPDTDGDGLPDRSELSGRATFGARQVDFKRTDPLQFSTRGDGVPDGYVARFGLDPHNATVADSSPMPGGLTVREAYLETERTCRADGAACDWMKRLVDGPLVDPTGWDSNGDGVPDAWVVRQSHGLLSPLDDARELVLDDTQEWDATVWGGNVESPSVVVDEANPRPKTAFQATLADYYSSSRPAGWNETTMGPWWGGIPSDLVPPAGALPPAVAMRGWNVTVDTCRGCKDDAARAEQSITLPASSDPRLNDTDGDGLPDLIEYFGWAGAPGPRTNPFDRDTDGDGLSDCVEAYFRDPADCRPDQDADPDGGLGTNPLRRDSSGSFLTDGEAYVYWSVRYFKAVADANAPRPASGSDPFATAYRFLLPPGAPAGARPGPADLERLKPLGTLNGDTPNLLSADPDGDGIPTGAELLPALYLDLPTTQERPATDPARADSDGDGLPDAWEISWSRMRYFVDCPTGFCVGPNTNFQGWPLNPARYDSFDPSASELSPGTASDASRNLKGDLVSTAPGTLRQFRTDLAYRYGGDKGLVSPFEADSSPADQIPDMFAIHWGIEFIPAEVRELVDGDPERFQWVIDAGERLEGNRPPNAGSTQITHAVMDPTQKLSYVDPVQKKLVNITLDSNLRGIFHGRDKGTWVFDPAASCSPGPLPADDPRTGSGPIPVGCWRWIGYPLRSDLQNRTNPWSDDFDADDLPDAWEFHYKLTNAHSGQVMPSSIDAGCSDEAKLNALPPPPTPTFYCLTYGQAYANGLDPNPAPITGDTDGGGLADWYEIALRDGPSQANLDPLNKLDDHGEEDWDGDGLLNRVEQQLGSNLLHPDTDRDGLLDGDPVGVEGTPFLGPNTGGGDLCIHPGSALIAQWPGYPPGTGSMANRPGFLNDADDGGPLTHTELVEWYRDLGILADRNPGRCPQDGHEYLLAKREAMLDRFSPQNPRPVLLGAGGGSDSLKWDTTGGGVPDGWAVFWRDRAGQSQSVRTDLDPTRPGIGQSNPDNDLPTRDEYRWGRPADWSEADDGPWWGGLDPTQRDTDGDELWFRPVVNGADSLDLDGDADGLPLTVDPYPDADHNNTGIISRSGDGYRTDFTKLWGQLARRSTFAALDRDGDTVPDAIDRARVRVTAEATKGGAPLEGLSKGNGTVFTVRGRVTLDEASRGSSYDLAVPASNPEAFQNAAGMVAGGTGVAGATVKVLLCAANPAKPSECGNGPVAVLGAALTTGSGDYTIAASLNPQVSASVLPARAVLHGTVYAAGSTPQLASNVDLLPPGPVKLWAMVEPNDPTLQAVTFGGKGAAQAYKDVGPSEGAPTSVPGVRPGLSAQLRAGRVAPDGGPDLDHGYIQHAAEAVFGGHSNVLGLNLRARAQFLDVTNTALPRRGDDFGVSGRLTDAAKFPLGGRTVTVKVGPPSAPDTYSTSALVEPDGTFKASFSTSTLPVGPLRLRIEAQLGGPGGPDAFLDAPPAILRDLTLSQKTTWGPPLARIDGKELADRSEVAIDPERPFRVSALLREAPSGHAVAGHAVRATIVANVGGVPTVLATRNATTSADGRADLEMPALPANTPPDTLQLRLVALPVTTSDEPAATTFFLNPLFPTRLTVSEGVGGLGERVVLRGHLERVLSGKPSDVTGAQGSIEATFGGQTLWANVTDEHGNFTIAVRSFIPAANTWTFRFIPAPGKLLQPSEAVTARALHTAKTTLSLVDGKGTLGEPVGVTGRLAWVPADVGVYGQPVRVGWKGGAATTTMSDAHGLFHAVLPPQPATGAATVVMAFDGSPAFGPSRREASVPILAPTRLALQLPDAVLDPTGGTADRVLLRLENGTQRLAGREVLVTFLGPGGANRSVERLTGSSGEAEVRVEDLALDRAGTWTVQATYAGSSTEQGASAGGAMPVTMKVRLLVDRVPSAAYPGDRILLQGRLLAPNHSPDAVPFVARLDGAAAGSAAAVAGVPWSLALRVPEDATPGDHILALAGSAPGIALEPVEVVLAVRTSVQAVLDVDTSPDGSRLVSLRFVDGAGQAVERGLHLVLIRQGEDGRVLGIHELDTASDGTGSLQLGEDQAGTVSVLQINDRLLALDSLAINTRALQPAPSGGIPAWLLWSGVVLGALVAGAAAWSYRAWRRSADQGLEAMLREARQSLADPTLPVAEVIRRAYASLLEVLRKAGYTPRDSDTVRGITATVESAFGLPKAPWRVVSGLFETAAYARAALAPSDRHAAQQAFGALAQWWSTRQAGPKEARA